MALITVGEAAIKYNLSRRTVYYHAKRNGWGINKEPPGFPSVWLIETEIADKYKLPETDWDSVSDLGKIPDVDIARRFGISPTAVQLARKRRGISALNPSKKLSVDWDSLPLGKMIDDQIASMVGCSGSKVCIERQKRGIKPAGMLYRTQEGQPAYYGEAVIDAWLHKHEIAHVFQFHVGKKRVDWYLPDTNEIWEYAGLAGHRLYGEDYEVAIGERVKICLNAGYKVRRIDKQELEFFSKDVDLSSIFKKSTFTCKGCLRTNVKHSSHDLCSMCLHRVRLGKPVGSPKNAAKLKPGEVFVCSSCGSNERNKRVKTLCGSCYSKARKKRILTRF